MPCDKYTETERQIITSQHVRSKTCARMNKKGLYYLCTLRIVFCVARASLTNIYNLTSYTLFHEFK